MTAARPTTVLGMRSRRRVDGSPFLVAMLDERLVLEVGDELHLQRIADGQDGVTHSLRVFPARVAPSRKDLEAARGDRLDGSAIRRDPRDGSEVSP